ncbi:MAG: Autotransporter adhesin [Myxococcaceae bacterium]|nr:Autotransporter adhesin [Myxococcaceae bacterium]
MRALVALGTLATTAVIAACTLTTDLGALSTGADTGGVPDSSVTPSNEGGTVAEGSAPDALFESGTVVDPYVAAVRADMPVAYYRFEDDADSNFAKDDLAAHPANVTQKGVTFGGTGVRNRGVLFDGSAALDIGDAFDFAGKHEFALEIWVKATTSSLGGHILRKRDETVAGNFQGYILYADGTGNPHFEGWGVDLSAWSDDPLPAAFAHVVLSVSYATGKGNATLYVNAQPAAHGGFDNVIDLADTPEHLLIGRGFVGMMDEAAIYAKALPPDRILAHYLAGKP